MIKFLKSLFRRKPEPEVIHAPLTFAKWHEVQARKAKPIPVPDWTTTPPSPPPPEEK